MAITTSQITITTMEGWYSGTTPPLNPLIGDLWLDTTSNEIKKYDGTNWIKQADTQGPQGPKGDSIKSREAYWIKSSTKPDKPDSSSISNWTLGSEPPENALSGISASDKFWRAYKDTYSNEKSEYSEVELIGSYEVLNGLVQFRNGVSTTENKEGQNITVIDGGKILTGSIEADKMSIKDLSALKATIGGFHIGKNSIYSGNKKTIDSTERGIYFDSNGQSYFGDDKNFIRFYRSDKDNYKLQISADSLTFGSGVSVEKAFENIKNDIQNAQDTADSKRRIFYSKPTVPYDAGDLWVQGSDGDILRCAQAKTSTGSYNRNDWILASKYTDDSALTTWIKGDFATTIQGLEEGLVDAKIETYYQTTDPSTEWPTDKKMEHKGDLWYNSTTSVQKYYRWSGTAWQELTATPPKEVFDSIDNKATIYTGTTPPSSPSQGDLWFKGANDPILTYVGNTWVEYNKYTDNTRAEEAYDKAGEAAKTADNYISADSSGIMVSENKGATKETPSNATKNNVLITEKDVQIRNGQDVVASYGETTIIGPETENHFAISPDSIKAKNGDIDVLNIILEAGATSKEARTVFHGEDIANEILSGDIYSHGINLRLFEKATEITKVFLYNKNVSPEDPDMVIDNTKNWIYYEVRDTDTGTEVQLIIEESYSEAKAVSWDKYILLVVQYTPKKQIDSTVTCDNLTVKGKIKVDKELEANSTLINGSLNVNDITLINREKNSIAYYDQSGSWADLIRIRRGYGNLSLTTGAVEYHPRWWRCGNIVQMEVATKCTRSVASGANIAAGKITGVPAPITKSGVRAVSYYGNNSNISYMGSDGTFYARNAGADALAKGNDCIGGFTYITDGTML